MSMPREAFLRTPDGARLHILDWPADPNLPPKGSVLVLHGLGEHGARYASFARFCNRLGLTVRAYDHRGHGHSSGARGDIRHPVTIIEDAAHVLDDFKRETDTLPILFGHTMGSLFAARFAAAAFAPIRTLILSSPALAVRLNAFQKRLLALFSRTLPHIALPNGLPVRYLSHDPQIVQAYRHDPAVHGKISATLLQAMLDAMVFCRTHADSIDLPVLLQVAGSDHLVDMQRSLDFHARLPRKRATLHVYPALYHEIFNEKDSDAVHADLRDWILRLPATQDALPDVVF